MSFNKQSKERLTSMSMCHVHFAWFVGPIGGRGGEEQMGIALRQDKQQ